jgi:hypothetical protein
VGKYSWHYDYIRQTETAQYDDGVVECVRAASLARSLFSLDTKGATGRVIFGLQLLATLSMSSPDAPNMSRGLKPLWDYEHAFMICTQRVFVNVNNHVFLLRSYP